MVDRKIRQNFPIGTPNLVSFELLKSVSCEQHISPTQLPNAGFILCSISRMAEPAVNGEQSMDLVETRKVLLSNSTKRRISELETLNSQLVGIGR